MVASPEYPRSPELVPSAQEEYSAGADASQARGADSGQVESHATARNLISTLETDDMELD